MATKAKLETLAARRARLKRRAFLRRVAGLCIVCRKLPQRQHGNKCEPCHSKAEVIRQRNKRRAAAVERRRAQFRIVHDNPAYMIELVP